MIGANSNPYFVADGNIWPPTISTGKLLELLKRIFTCRVSPHFWCLTITKGQIMTSKACNSISDLTTYYCQINRIDLNAIFRPLFIVPPLDNYFGNLWAIDATGLVQINPGYYWASQIDAWSFRFICRAYWRRTIARMRSCLASICHVLYVT